MNDITALFFPPRCAACGGALPDGEDFLCLRCRWEVPLTYYWQQPDNALAARLKQHAPIERAAALFFFTHGGDFRQMIHDFKYNHDRWSARRAGTWFGHEIKAPFADIDVVVPVPLHITKWLQRGYNQAEQIARGMAEAMEKPLAPDSVVRRRGTPSQARQLGTQRWDNVAGAFAVRQPEKLNGKHILLVDDVVTTGATLLSLAETISIAVPDCRLSVVALATTRERVKKKPNAASLLAKT